MSEDDSGFLMPVIENLPPELHQIIKLGMICDWWKQMDPAVQDTVYELALILGDVQVEGSSLTPDQQRPDGLMEIAAGWYRALRSLEDPPAVVEYQPPPTLRSRRAH